MFVSLIVAFRSLVVVCYGANWNWCYEGYCYHESLSTFTSWSDCRAYCETLGTKIVSIHSEMENTYIHNVCGEKCAIGFLRESYYRWAWLDRSPVDYTNWCSNEPDSGDYALISYTSSDGCWRSYHSEYDSDSFHALCKRVDTPPTTQPVKSPESNTSNTTVVILATLVCCQCLFIIGAGLWLKIQNSRKIMSPDIEEMTNMSQLGGTRGKQSNTNAHIPREGIVQGDPQL